MENQYEEEPEMMSNKEVKGTAQRTYMWNYLKAGSMYFVTCPKYDL